MAVRMTPRGGGTLATTLTERKTPPAWAWRAQPGPRRPQLPPVVGAHPQGNRAFGAPDWCWTRDNNLQHADRGQGRVARCGQASGMRDGHLRGELVRPATPRQWDVLAAYVATGGSVADAARLMGIRPSTVKRHLADLRARSGLSTEQLIYAGRASGRLIVPSLEPSGLARASEALGRGLQLPS